MNCPVCQKAMQKLDLGIEVSVCVDGCKGLWLEQGQLARVDAQFEGDFSELEELGAPAGEHLGGILECPKCGIPMHKHKHRDAAHVEIDECYQCGGVFLDAGELEEIKRNKMNPAQQEAYVKQLMAAIPEYGLARDQAQFRREKMEGLGKFTKFLSFSRWMRK